MFLGLNFSGYWVTEMFEIIRIEKCRETKTNRSEFKQELKTNGKIM